MEFVATVTSWFTPTALFLLLNLMIGTIVITSRFGSGPNKHHPTRSLDPFGSGHAHYHTPLARAPSLIDRVKSINFHLYKFPSPDTHYLHVTGSDPHLDPDPAPLARAPSLLDRVKSVNLSNFKFPQYQPDNDYAPTTRPEEENPVGSTRVDSLDPTLFNIPKNDEHRDVPVPVPGPELVDPVDTPRLTRAPSLLERVKSINFSSFYRPDPTHVDHHDPDPPKENHKPRRSKSETKKPSTTTQKMTKSSSERHVETAEETAEAVERRRPETVRVERSASFGGGEDSVDAKAADFINRFKQQLKLQRLDSILRYKEMLKAK